MSKIAMIALIGFAGVCLNLSELSAWERTPMDEARCKDEGKTLRRCKKENAEDNEYVFGTLLTTQTFKVFNDFSPEEKKQAMDYADHNAMDPNDAVAKVRKQPAH